MTELVGETVIEPQLTSAFLRGRPGTLDRLNAVLEDEDGLVHHTLIRPVKIWSPDGKVLYSNDPSEIGRSYRPDDERAERPRLRSHGGHGERSEPGRGRLRPVARHSHGRGLHAVGERERRAGALRDLHQLRRGQAPPRQSLFTTCLLVTASLLAVFALFQVRFFALNLRWLREQPGELAGRRGRGLDARTTQRRPRPARRSRPGADRHVVPRRRGTCVAGIR